VNAELRVVLGRLHLQHDFRRAPQRSRALDHGRTDRAIGAVVERGRGAGARLHQHFEAELR
jgi:hypothetical protein